MRHPDFEESMLTENFLRPRLDKWTRSLPLNPEDFTDFYSKLFSRVKTETARLTSEIRLNQDFIEPIDPVLGKDVMLRRTGAFACGASLGLTIAAPIIRQRPGSIRAGTNHVKEIINPSLASMTAGNPTELAYERSTLLVNKGSRTLELFEEAKPDIESLIEKRIEDIDLQLAAVAGAGLILRAVWEGYKTVETESMLSLSEKLRADNPYLDIEIASHMRNY